MREEKYLDVIKKIDFYKQQIYNEYISKGVFPNDKLVQEKLNNIDKYLSLFKYYNVTTGQKFNTNEYNEMIKLIMLDLQYLYEILYKLTIEEYNKIQNFALTHLSELNSIIETYEKRTKFENNSTTLGQTILFQSNNFIIDTQTNITKVKLKNVFLKESSLIACIANINNVKPEDVIFEFKNTISNKIFNVNSNTNNNDILKIPGEKKYKQFNFSLTDGLKTTNPLLINIDNAINEESKYIILNNKDNIKINYEDNDIEYLSLSSNNNAIKINKKSYIEFYVLDGDMITFKFNKNPISANFSLDNSSIKITKKVQHFYLECDKDTFFQIQMNKGTIYSIADDGIIQENRLYYTNLILGKDFCILEEEKNKSEEYECILKIYNNEAFNIENIVIKQIE